MKCMNQVNAGSWCQESYETSTRDAGRRAKQLRGLGYQVSVGSIGPQVTPLGTIKTTLVTVRPGVNADTFGLPEVENGKEYLDKFIGFVRRNGGA